MNSVLKFLKKLKPTLVAGIISVAFLIFTPVLVSAAGILVTYPGSPGPLFNELNLAPGNVVEEIVTVQNNDSSPQKIGFKVKNGPSGELKDHLLMEVRKGSLSLAGPLSLSDFYGFFNETEIETLPAGASGDYRFIVTLDKNIGNEFQNKSEDFDLSLGFIASEVPDPESPGEPENVLTPLIDILTALTEPFVATFPAEETPEVAGEVTADLQDIQGNTDEGGTSRTQQCPWWWIVLMALTLLLAVYYFWELRHERRKFWWIVPTAFTIVAILVHLYFHRFFQESPFCDWVWLLAILLLFIASTVYVMAGEKKEGSS